MSNLEVNEKEQEPFLFECKCKKCGKVFFPTPLHVYKDNKGKYCSWTCFNHRNDGKKSRWQAVEGLYPDGTPVRTFRSVSQASEWIGGKITGQCIKDACTNGTKYNGYLWRFKDEKN